MYYFFTDFDLVIIILIHKCTLLLCCPHFLVISGQKRNKTGITFFCFFLEGSFFGSSSPSFEKFFFRRFLGLLSSPWSSSGLEFRTVYSLSSSWISNSTCAFSNLLGLVDNIFPYLSVLLCVSEKFNRSNYLQAHDIINTPCCYSFGDISAYISAIYADLRRSSQLFR